MKRLFLISLLAVLSASLLVVTTASAAELTFDSERSTLNWVSEAPSEKIVGTASGVEGTIQWSVEDLENLTGKIQFPVSSMQSGNSLRDRHLQGRDWLRADQNPNIIFELEGLEDVERTPHSNQVRVEATAVGKLTVNGVTRPIRSKVKLAILTETNRVRIQTNFGVNLKEHEVQGRRGAIGDEVAEVIEVEGVLYGSWQ